MPARSRPADDLAAPDPRLLARLSTLEAQVAATRADLGAAREDIAALLTGCTELARAIERHSAAITGQAAMLERILEAVTAPPPASEARQGIEAALADLAERVEAQGRDIAAALAEQGEQLAAQMADVAAAVRDLGAGLDDAAATAAGEATQAALLEIGGGEDGDGGGAAGGEPRLPWETGPGR